MTEWTVFGIIVALVSAFLLVYTPIRESRKERENERIQQEKEAAKARVDNTKAITELTASLKYFSDRFDRVERENHEEHEAIYHRLNDKGKTLAAHDEKLKDHDRRLENLEEKV